jgi:single-strand DNA-binding protein
MSITTAITVVGNLTEDPALRFTQSGTAVASVTIASTERYFDRSSNEWKDGETTFVRGTVWKNNGAENLAESLEKGARVIAYGKLKQRTYDDREGNKRSVIEMDIEEIGPSVKYATATPVKPQRTAAPAPADNAWQTAPATV